MSASSVECHKLNSCVVFHQDVQRANPKLSNLINTVARLFRYVFIGGSGDTDVMWSVDSIGGNSLPLDPLLPVLLADITIFGSKDLTTSQWLFFRCTMMGSSFALVSLTTVCLPTFRGAIDDPTSQYVNQVPLP